MIYLKYISIFLWIIAIIFLFVGSFKYSFILKFPQLKIKKIFNSSKNISSDGISPFKSLCMSLAARIGVGSLSGIAIAIYYGGVGTIFWIWIIGIIMSVNSFVESYLGVKYQEKDGGFYVGGPSYYIKKGLRKNILAKAYAILVIITYIVGFMSIQSNTISICINKYYGINPNLIGIIISVVTFIVIINGIKNISNITSKLVPLMGVVYVFICVYIIIYNIDIIPSILLNIIKSAFNFKSFSFGFLPTFLIGVQRGIFSTESGLGTSSIAISSTKSNNNIGIGLFQILGIYFTVFVICTSTALLLMTSDYNLMKFNNINGIELIQYSLQYHMGKIGIIILIFSVVTFAFSTIVAGYYYGESNLKFLLPKSNNGIIFLKIFTIVIIFFGSIVKSQIIWDFIDIFVALLSIINMYSLLKFSNEVKRDYNIFLDKT